MRDEIFQQKRGSILAKSAARMGVTMLTTRELDAIESELHRMMADAGDSGGMSVLETADYAIRTNWRLLKEYRELKKYFAIYNDSAARIAG